MKGRAKSLFLLLALPVVLAACGSGGGGGNTSGTFTKTVDNGALSTTSGFMDYTHPTSHWQNLYLASNIAGSGNITGISFQYQDVMTSSSCPNTTIKLSHSNQPNLTGTFANNLSTGQGGQTTVLSNGTMVFPAGAAGTWHTVTFSTPFNYNGVDNLIVDFTLTSVCAGKIFDDQKESMPYVSTVWTFTGAATGTTGPYLQDMKFNFSGGTDSISYTDDGTTSSLNSYPFTSSAKKVQLLYLANEINGSGYITGIGFPVGTNPRGGTTTAQTYTVNVRLGHTNLSALTTTFANNFTMGTPVTVANAINFTVPAGIPDGAFVWIPLPDGTFNYNGTDNLIVELETPTPGTGTTWWIHDSSGANTRLTDVAGATTGATDAEHYGIKFRFAGGTMDVIGSNDANAAVFGTGVGGRQFLLRAAELGASGSINKLACRAFDTTTAASYPNFTVTLAHTAQNSLVATDATNVAGGTVVYNGTFNMPGGLLAGDWVEIPFSTPFNYNGVDNLVVQTTTGSGPSAYQYCQISGTDVARFSGRWKATGGSTPQDYRGTFRFWVNK